MHMSKAKIGFTAAALLLIVLIGLILWKEHRPKQRPRDPTGVPESQPYHSTPQQAKFFNERLNFGKWLGLALQTIAKDNGGQVPPDLTSAGAWLETNTVPIRGQLPPKVGIGVANFELIFKGNLSDLKDPPQTILARERIPVEVHQGRWNRMYVFADGSVIRLEATTSDGFSAREKEVWPAQPK